MADEQRIRVIRPDGRVSTIPASSMPEAIRRGYKPASGGASGSWTPETGGDKFWRFMTTGPGHIQLTPPKGEDESLSGYLWRLANTPLVPKGRAEQEGHAYAVSAPSKDTTSPTWDALKRGTAGTYADTAETARSFSTPLALSTFGLSRLAKGVGAAGKIARVAQPFVAGGFGGQGAYQSLSGVSDMAEKGITPENSREALGGAGQAILGGVGGKESAEALRKSTIPKGSGSQSATRPLVQKYLMDRSLAVQDMLQKAGNTFNNMIGQRWQNIEKTVDNANPQGSIDASRLRAHTADAQKELIATPQKLPTAVQQIAAKGEMPRVMGSKLDLTNPIHKGLYDRLVEEGALPSADKISWQESRQIRSKLGRELRGHSQLSGEAKVLGWRIYDDLTNQMRDAAEKYGMGKDFDVANKLHQQYMQDFKDSDSPLYKAINGSNPHEIFGPLSSPEYAEQARRVMSKYRNLGIKTELVSKEGNLFQKYKEGLPKQWEANRWEITADLFTAGLPTGVRITHNLLSRAKALRELQP